MNKNKECHNFFQQADAAAAMMRSEFEAMIKNMPVYMPSEYASPMVEFTYSGDGSPRMYDVPFGMVPEPVFKVVHTHGAMVGIYGQSAKDNEIAKAIMAATAIPKEMLMPEQVVNETEQTLAKVKDVILQLRGIDFTETIKELRRRRQAGEGGAKKIALQEGMIARASSIFSEAEELDEIERNEDACTRRSSSEEGDGHLPVVPEESAGPEGRSDTDDPSAADAGNSDIDS